MIRYSLIYFITLFYTFSAKSNYTSDTTQINYWNTQSNENCSINLETAILYADSAINLSLKVNFQKGYGLGVMYKGLAYDYAGKFEHAITLYDSSAIILQKNENIRELGLAISNKGIANLFVGNYNEAVKYLLESSIYFQNCNYTKGIASNLNNLGLIARKQNNYDKALNYYTESIEYKRKIGDLKGEMLTLGNISSIYIYLNDWEKALIYNEKSSQIAIILNAPQLAENYIDKATILSGLNKITEAKYYYHKSIPLLKKYNFQQSLTVSYVGLGSVFLYDNILDSSEFYFNEALNLLNKVDYADYRLEVLYGLAAVHEKKQEFKIAYQYLQDYLDLKNNLQNTAQTDEIKDLEAKYNYLAQKEKINNLKHEKIVANLKLKQNAFNQKIMWAGIVSILIILIYIIRLYRKMEKQKNIATDALHDKELLLKEIHHRVKNNLQLVSSLLFLQSENIEDDIALDAINESRTRVEAMAIIHQKLYKEDNVLGISTSDYVDNLVDGIFDTLEIDEDDINVIKIIDELSLDIDSTIPIGLILNELITNAIKHAFPNSQKNKNITIELTMQPHFLKLKVSDNGEGNKNLKPSHSSGFGQKLITMFAKKLKASKIVDESNGYCVELQIKKYTLQ